MCVDTPPCQATRACVARCRTGRGAKTRESQGRGTWEGTTQTRSPRQACACMHGQTPEARAHTVRTLRHTSTVRTLPGREGVCVCVTQCERRPSLTWRTAEGLPRSGHRRRTLSPACSHTPSCNDTRCVWVAWLAGREGCKHKDTHNRIDAVCARRGVCI